MPRTVHALALVSALCSAGATIFIRQGLRGRGPYTGFWINLVVGTVGLWAAVLLTGGFGHPSAAGVAFFVLAGLIGTVAGRLLRFVSIDKVGASVAASLINLHPLVATGVAILLLGERVTAPILAGTGGIVLRTTLLSVRGPATAFVARLYGTAPIFVLFLSFFFLRGVETLSARLVLGTLLIVLGVYLITALSGR